MFFIKSRKFPKASYYKRYSYKKRQKLRKKASKYRIIIYFTKIIFIFLMYILYFLLDNDSFISLIKNKTYISSFNNNNTYNYSISKNNNNDNYNIKVCLCTPCKNENRYIREFIEHYKNYGLDKLYIYDNNDINGERLETVIGDYINSGFVEVFDWRGKKRALLFMMNDCYKRNYQKYDWLVFFEIDEYIHLTNYSNIKPYLNQEQFKKCQKIHLNWVHHTDNNLIIYDNRTLKERFPEVEPNAVNNVKGSINSVKSILRGHIPNVKIYCVHKLTSNLLGCDGFGNRQIIKGIDTNNSDFRNFYIDHYYSKSLEEFAQKLNKGDVLQGQDLWLKMLRINNYFRRNKITLAKIEYLEKNASLNLSFYRDILKKQNLSVLPKA